MDQIISNRPAIDIFKVKKLTGLILGGTFVASLMIGWIAFLLWLIAEGVIAIVHWL